MIQPSPVTAYQASYISSAAAAVADEEIAIADADSPADSPVQIAQLTPQTDDDEPATDAPTPPPLSDLPAFSTVKQDDSLELIPPSPTGQLLPQIVSLE